MKKSKFSEFMTSSVMGTVYKILITAFIIYEMNDLSVIITHGYYQVIKTDPSLHSLNVGLFVAFLLGALCVKLLDLVNAITHKQKKQK